MRESELFGHVKGVFTGAIRNRENGKRVTKITREVLAHLLAYPWPGNVRELENCIEHAVVMSPGNTLSASLLPTEILAGAPAGGPRGRSAGAGQRCSNRSSSRTNVRRGTVQIEFVW